MSERRYKPGEIAERTGVTVRTLRYYDEIGLLKPAERARSGYRLYGPEQLERLQQILSLKHLGLELEEIGECLKDPEAYSLENILYRQLKRLRIEIERQKQLYRRLETLAEHLDRSEKPSIDELFKTLKAMTMYEKYYSKQQLEYLEQRKTEVGEERIREVQREWKELIGQVRKEMENGTDPQSEKMQQLAVRWQSLIEEFTGGKAGIRESLGKMYKNEGPEKASRGFMDGEVGEYMQKAFSAGDLD